jgi:hypothetical protein
MLAAHPHQEPAMPAKPLSMSRRHLLRTAAGAAVLGAAALRHVQAADVAEAQAERLLNAIGGRAAWARANNMVLDAQHNRADEAAVLRTVVAVDFKRPRFRHESTAPGLLLIRVLDADRHWQLARNGSIAPMAAEQLAQDRRWYAAHPMRTLHRMAVRDAALGLQMGRNGRLEVMEAGRRLAWFALDGRHEPQAYGAFDDDAGTACGPWEVERRGLRHPLWTTLPDGSLRTLTKALDVNIELGGAFFEPPAVLR